MWKTAGLAALAVAAAGGALAWLVRRQMIRHRRDLFSPSPLRRLACLGHLARSRPTVDNITLLRDYVVWEPTAWLRNRGRVILTRMEREATRGTPRAGEKGSQE